MAYRAPLWPKVVLGIPAAAVVLAIAGEGVSEQVDRYQNRAATERAREAMRSCAAEHGVDLVWERDPSFLTFDAEVLHFSAATDDEIAAANCIVERAAEMGAVAERRYVCLHQRAKYEVQRVVSGQHYAPREDNYRFLLYECRPTTVVPAD